MKMDKASIQSVALGLTMILLAGCTSLSEQILALEDNMSPTARIGACLKIEDEEDRKQEKREQNKEEEIAKLAEKIKDEQKIKEEQKVEEKNEGKKRNINDFLDCVFDVKVDQEKLELRLVRGHAIVGVLAVYGLWSVQFDAAHQKDDASRLLSRIENAEKHLWDASNYKPVVTNTVSEDKTTSTSSFTWPTRKIAYKNQGKNQKASNKKPIEPRVTLKREPSRLKRIVSVTQVVTAAGKPAARRTRSLIEKVFSGIASAVSTGSPAGLLSSGKDIRDAIKRAMTTRIYGSAYFSALKEFLENVKAREDEFPILKDWKAVDDEYLKGACDDLAKIVGREHTCIPFPRNM